MFRPIVLRRYAHKLNVLAVFAASAVILGGAPGVQAQVNAGCSGSPGADCTDVGPGGISYTSGVTTVNVGDGVPGTTVVNPGTIGIQLSRSGVNGASPPDADFTTIKWDTDNDPDTPAVDVVSMDGSTPYLSNGDYITVATYDAEQNPLTFTIGTGDDAVTYTGTELAQHLAANEPGSGAAISGSLTVNNNAGASSQGAPFGTTNAGGIVVSSTGGTGGNGSCHTILLLYTWCSDGSSGGSAGSVAVNSNSTIVVDGDANGKNGITAISQGGTGGKGGGFVGLVSEAGGGGNGGNSSLVSVLLGANSSITTHGDKGDGVYALSRGGDGGSGGHASAAFALGSDGGNGGDAGDVLVVNQGSILTTGWNAHGIYASSVGAGAGSGSSASGIYAEGGNGGGESDGAKVTVNNSGSVTTQKSDSFGILAQSIGGGGGDGGGAGGWFTVGGRGGSGGGSDVVTVFDSGKVQTGGDRSTAIFAQSIGGGGGNGGDAVSISAAVSVAVGGSGGPGGKGDEVHVTAQGGDIETVGNSSHGIQAQSIGGGGGNGGLAVAGTLTTGGGLNVSVALGGSGGLGGDAGDLVEVKTDSATTIGTLGNASYGIMAQSIGGGGGNGGMAFAGSGGPGLSVAVGIGGKGGGGGSGKDVSIDNAGTIATAGDLSAGIFTQSIGGGGGNGGFAGSLAVGGTSVGVSVGGSGGSGGAAGQIGVTNSGTIATAGKSAAGIFAQSVGGGGGNGGSAFAGSIGVASVTTAVGGAGGAGNDGNLVDIVNSGLIATQGNNSAGIFAQSIGGGGGSGGDATSLSLAGPVAVAVGVGGAGGWGGNGGQVIVGNQGRIAATGPNSDGIFAQSVGGSGGEGGSATTGTLAFPIEVEEVEIPAISVNVAVGGRGGGGGVANTVTVTNGGQIDTAGFMSNGVFAQSVGGSGGKGGHATNISLSYDATFTGKVAVGGSGGQGGTGNKVTVGNGGVIHTQGDFSSGVFAQSVGGGGGAGGNATNFSLSLTPPPTAPEDFIPSPSGNFDLAIGGNGGNGATGGDVEVSNSGSIRTDGKFAAGVMAQSVGGSGGTGGDARSIQVELTADPMDFMPLTSLTSLDMTMVFGGTGGSGSHGGKVTVTNESNVTTTGTFSHGIVAQSVGGGGGSGGSAMTFQFSNANAVPEIPVLDDISGLTNLSMTLQGSGGAGGNGGDVTLNSTGHVRTSGDFAMGVVAQSVGGGGGLAGFYNPQGVTNNEIVDSIFNTYVDTEAGFSFAGSVGGAGTAGHVVVNHTGSIETTGDGAHGLFAQSAAGQGRAGNVDVTLTGSIIASGKNADGIYAQSGGGGGNGNIAIAVNDGIVSGGSGTGAGVAFSGGAANSLVNHGSITSVPGVQGRAIVADSGNESIDNYGTVTGSVELGAGVNSFHNQSGATLNSGATLSLGAGGVLTNEGTFSPGGSGTILATALAGNLLQTPSGTYLVDLNLHTNVADRTSVSGSAGLAGRVQVASHDPELAAPGDHRVTILSSAGGVANSGLSLSSPTSAIVQYQLLFPDPTSVVLDYGVHFSPPGLNGNQGAIGNYLSNVQSAGGFPGLGPIVGALVGMPDAHGLASGYDHLSPEPYLGAATGTLFSNIGFSDAMHSCGVPGGANRFVRQGECDWFRLIGGEANQERTASNMASDRWSLSLSTGAQRAVGDGSWHAGWGFAYEYSTLRAEQLSNSSGNQLQLGAIVKKEYGATSLAADLSVGYGDYDSDRFVNLPVPNVTAHSTQDVKFLSGHLRLAHAFEQGANWYLKPMVDLGATHSWFAGFQETGAGAANLDVASRTETYVELTPALEIGGETRLSNGLLLRPYVKLGVTHFVSGASPEITASFQGAPVGVAPFTVKGEMDKTYTNVHIGLTLLNKKGQILQVGYFGSFSDHLKSNSGMVKLSIPF
jgi:hypothetical protein